MAASTVHENGLDTDLLIVGAGPVGLYGAYYAGFRGLRVAVIDALAEHGGQVSALYPEKRLYDVAGLPSVRGRKLIDNLVRQAAASSPTYLLGEEAQRLARADDESRFTVTTAAGRVISCGAIVITAGIGSFTPRPLAPATAYLERGLAYFVTEPDTYSGADVVIAGGGDSACDWAMMLASIARTVTLVHRRTTFRAHAASVAAIHRSAVRVLAPAEVTACDGADALERVTVTRHDTGEAVDLPCTRLVAALGFTSNLGRLREWGLTLDGGRHFVVDRTMATNAPGVFAAGDVAEYPGKVRLIAVGFGEVATAVNHAAVYLNPGEQLFPGHSTDAAPTTA